ncbi:MAG: HEAT repeat domain-containing protein [Pirellulaceae bacterium]
MEVLRTVVTSNASVVAEVQRLLKEGSLPERILAAQVWGFMPYDDAADDLVRAAERDVSPAVRLYAVDSLSMLDGQKHQAVFRRLGKSEKNRDVKRHLAYALERKDTSVRDRVVESFRKWEMRRLDTASVGEMAPDFELACVSGEKLRLSSYRGGKSVVLAFVYGDT